MKTTVTYHIWPTSTSWADVFASSARLASERGFIVEEFSYTQVTESRVKTHLVNSIQEAIPLLTHLQSFERFISETRFSMDTGSDKLTIGIDVANVVQIAVGASHIDTVEGVHASLQQQYQLRNPTLPESENPLHLQPTVFVGRHFDAKGDEAFRNLESFLTLLGFHVMQGLEYESRDIPDKVKERIERQAIFIGLVTGARDHSWLHSEPAYAMGKRKHVILIVEKGAEYVPTILGKDLEQIRFPPSTIEKSFISLLRELRNIHVRGL